MEFLISVIDSQSGAATADEMTAIDAFNARLEADGHWVIARGVSSPDRAVLIDGRGTEPEVTIGPLHGGRDYISGFWVVRAPDLEAARELAVEGSRACNRRVELRPILGG